jgi:hypothetical protein
VALILTSHFFYVFQYIYFYCVYIMSQSSASFFIALLCVGIYKSFTMYQIYHTWIHPLHCNYMLGRAHFYAQFIEILWQLKELEDVEYRAGGVAQVVEPLPSKLSKPRPWIQTPLLPKKKKWKYLQQCQIASIQ